jgi:hypothetical protein
MDIGVKAPPSVGVVPYDHGPVGFFVAEKSPTTESACNSGTKTTRSSITAAFLGVFIDSSQRSSGT